MGIGGVDRDARRERSVWVVALLIFLGIMLRKEKFVTEKVNLPEGIADDEEDDVRFVGIL